jgi:hypothetical protein
MARKYTRKRRRHRVKRGGQDKDNFIDLEKGPEVNYEYITNLPAKSDRFKQYERQMLKESMKPITSSQAAAVFAGPNPEEREEMARQNLLNEDKRLGDRFDEEELKMWGNFETGGKKSRKRRRSRSRRSRSRSRGRR